MKALAVLEYWLVFSIGAVSYGGIELLWRGETHWTMLLAGGLSLLALYLIGRYAAFGLFKKCILGAALITTLEFLVGGLVNLRLGWGVWDYSGLPLNLLGQICPRFSFYWFLLCLPGFGLCALLRGMFAGLSAYTRSKHDTR